MRNKRENYWLKPESYKEFLARMRRKLGVQSEEEIIRIIRADKEGKIK